MDDLTVLSKGSKSVVIGHPLWRRDIPGWNDQQQTVADKLRHGGSTSVVMSDYLDLERFPFSPWASLQ